MKEIILKTIKEIEQSKKDLKKAPALVLDSELSEAVTKKVLSSLRQLYKEGVIHLGKTINNNYIKIRENPSEPLAKVSLHDSVYIPKEKEESKKTKEYKCIYCEYKGDKDSFQVDLSDKEGFDIDDMTCDKCHLNNG